VTGFGRLRHLGVDIAVDPALRALARLDAWLAERHQRIIEARTCRENHLDPMVALYLYGRSFFLKGQPIAATARAAVDYFLDQARQYWRKLPAASPKDTWRSVSNGSATLPPRRPSSGRFADVRCRTRSSAGSGARENRAGGGTRRPSRPSPS